MLLPLKHTSKAVLLAAVSLALPIKNMAQSNQKKPNLLIIHTDEQSFRSLSCYENSWKEARTPHIDKLADNGVRFENFYANHPVCTPSRSALLTGRYAQEVQSYFNDIPLADEAITLGHIFKQNGYITGYVGKWHLDGHDKPGFGPRRNFGFEDNRYMFNRGHWKQITEANGQPQVKTYKDIGDEESYTTDFLANKTIEFIKQHKGQKWCHMLSIPDPHGPDVDRQPYNSMYNEADVSVPESFSLLETDKPRWASRQKGKNDPEARLRHTKARYLGMVKHIDDCVGEIMQALKKSGQLENTVVVFTSDHGDMMGEFGRYNKGIPLDASAKVAHIIHYPSKINKGMVINEVVSNVDFIPTLIDLMGIDYADEALCGESVVPLLSESRSDVQWGNTAFISVGKLVAVVTPHYKLVYSEVDVPWLYDREKDPDEVKNYFNDAAYGPVIKELTVKLKNYLVSTHDPNWTGGLGELYRRRTGKVKNNVEFSSLKEYVERYAR